MAMAATEPRHGGPLTLRGTADAEGTVGTDGRDGAAAWGER